MTYIAPRHDTVRVKDIFTEASETGRYRRCVACGGPTTHTSVNAGGATTEYSNALVMELFGAYSMFFDALSADANHTVILCHDCAHDACDSLPWLAALLEPANAHSHTEQYRDANPDHYGWDYDMANGTYYDKIADKLFPADECDSCGHERAKHERKELMAVWLCGEGCNGNKGCHLTD